MHPVLDNKPPLLQRCLRIPLLIAFLTAAVLTQSAISATEDPHQAKKEQIDKGIKKTTISIGRLQEGIKRQEEQLRESKQIELTLLTELQDIDTRLAEQNYKIEALEARMKKQTDMVF